MEYFIVIVLVCFSALFSGLTLGFFSLDKDTLKRKRDLGDVKAEKIYSVRENGNLLLCTLLIGNVAVNSALSIFLGSIVSGLIAGLTATALIVVFGEIVPQAIFSRHALHLGSKVVWIVKIFIFIFYPVCKPLSWILDKILGNEVTTIYSKKEIMKLIEDHEDSKESSIDADEEKIIKGALSFSKKQVEDIMTPRSEVFSLSLDQRLDRAAVNQICKTGHSRIPVYEDNLDNVKGILYAKDLIREENLKDKNAGEMCRRDEVIFVDYDKPLDDLLNAFQETRHHLFIVISEYGLVQGIVTIEDVLEEIIGEEIMDEFDQYEDLQKEAKNKMKKMKINKI